MSRYLTMGPAMSCGNSEMYSAKDSRFFWTRIFPVYRSMMYERIWNV